MALEDFDLVNTDLGHSLKISVGKAIVDNELDSAEHRVPTGFEDVGGLLPRQPLRPAGQKDLVGEGQPLLAVAPRQRLHLDAAGGTVHPAWRIAVVALEIPDRQIREQTLGLSIV